MSQVVLPSILFIDRDDTNPGDGTCDDGTGKCTLRAAIRETNASVNLDTIFLPSGVYSLTIAGADENAGVRGDLDITDDLLLTGSGSEETVIKALMPDRVLHIINSTVVISRVTIQNGSDTSDGGGIFFGDNSEATLYGCNIHNNKTTFQGGEGIYSHGVLTITNCFINLNTAHNGGGGIRAGNTIKIGNTAIASNISGYIGAVFSTTPI